MPGGSLTVVGTGIKLGSHLTAESRAAMESADRLFYLAADGITEQWLASQSRCAVSLLDCYVSGKERKWIYAHMVERILSSVRGGEKVCVAIYGHPGVFVNAAHASIAQARQEGYPAKMLPAVSAEDCLFADLGVDPAANGCQSYEATDFLLYRRRIDNRAALILWQAGMIGQFDYRTNYSTAGVSLLSEALAVHYPANHPIILYEAAIYPICDGRQEKVMLAELSNANIGPATTLYISAAEPSVPDETIKRRLTDLVAVSTRNSSH
jgi:uncharacterized protein YabN with tetrapyrrole methylase and pyrophosphatase domain